MDSFEFIRMHQDPEERNPKERNPKERNPKARNPKERNPKERIRMHTSPRTRGPTGTHADPRTRGPGTPRTRGPADRPGTPRGPQKFPTRRIATQGPRTHPRTLNSNFGFGGSAHWPLSIVKNPSSIRCLGNNLLHKRWCIV